MGEDIRPWQILRQFADEDHWGSEGYCGVCGGETYQVEHNANGQRYYASSSRPGTHTSCCAWHRAQQLIAERYGLSPEVASR